MFTFIYHCDIITHAWRRTLRGRPHHYYDIDQQWENSAPNMVYIACFICYDLNHHGRIEIDHNHVVTRRMWDHICSHAHSHNDKGPWSHTHVRIYVVTMRLWCHSPVLKYMSCLHLITYTLGKGRTQIDYILFHKTFHKHVMDVKVIPGEEIAKQHHLLVCDFRTDTTPPTKKKFIPHLRIWRLRQPDAQTEYQKAFITETTSNNACGSGTEGTWEKLKSVEGSWKCVRVYQEKRPGGGIRLLTVQSRKSGDAGKLERKVAARQNIIRPGASPNMLFIWQNPRLNKKSSRTLYPAALTFFTSPTKWDVKTSHEKKNSSC